MNKLFLSLILSLVCSAVNADTKIIVPVAPGATVDDISRLVGTGLSTRLNKPVTIENKPGASGIIALEYVAKSNPDGQTLFIGNNGNVNMNPVLNPSIGYTSTSFAPICMIGGSPLVLFVSGKLPVNNFKELIEYLKTNPEKASWASPGIGLGVHLMGEQLKSQYELTSMVHVLYKGMSPAIIDVIEGRVTMFFDLYTGKIASLVESGKLKPIFVTDNKRLSVLPNIEIAPTQSLVSYAWFGLFTVAGTPDSTVKSLQTMCNSILTDPDSRTKLDALGVYPLNIKDSELQKYVNSERIRWTHVIKKLNVRVD